MITKIKSSFDGPRRNNIYPSDYYLGDLNKPITHQQRKTLENLIYSRVYNPEEVDRRINEIESYDYNDAQEMITDLLLAPRK
ncbi:MAG: hypothetical protein NT077_01245 [Candidatus Taylorbacteria bacterium]|nr:hypothetical protein [Candidatus Taylorbacteria bacterium]